MKSEVEKALEFYKERGIKSNPGYVYILKADNGLYKIGMSSNPKGRIKAIRTASPVKVVLYRLFYSSNMADAEAMLHLMFEDFRVCGEWFNLSNVELEILNDREGDHILEHCYI